MRWIGAWLSPSTALGYVGAILVASGHVLAGQMVWVIGNGGLVYRNWRRGDRPQAVMFGVYWVIALAGVLNWWGR